MNKDPLETTPAGEKKNNKEGGSPFHPRRGGKNPGMKGKKTLVVNTRVQKVLNLNQKRIKGRRRGDLVDPPGGKRPEDLSAIPRRPHASSE